MHAFEKAAGFKCCIAADGNDNLCCAQKPGGDQADAGVGQSRRGEDSAEGAFDAAGAERTIDLRQDLRSARAKISRNEDVVGLGADQLQVI
ncbi:MAG: hypothetical protein A2603_10305 [Bdellovibrionales bacterium RIFOXYD1_FULL_55_31]|nr:MAG: hypothetical protein A2603_10305 [Bdellovibrionales bacterium RIFOXYD1_FULL_55_31]